MLVVPKVLLSSSMFSVRLQSLRMQSWFYTVYYWVQLKLWQLFASTETHRLKSRSHARSGEVVQRCNLSGSPLSFGRAQIGQLLRICLGIWIPLVFKTGGSYDREIISRWMFYRGPLDSRSYRRALSSLCFLDLRTWVQIFIGRGERKKASFVPPSRFVITKEQTLIRHTQAEEAVIVVSAVLQRVAEGDSTSHWFIYIYIYIDSFLHPHAHTYHGQSGVS